MVLNTVTQTNLNNASQAEVRHLADQVLTHQDVPGCQVSVHDIPVLQVCHTLCNLTAHVDQVG